MNIKEIAVLGGGNGSLTIAGDMSLAGYNIRMWTAFPQEFEALYKTKTVKLKGRGRKSVDLRTTPGSQAHRFHATIDKQRGQTLTPTGGNK